jgi:hypothetical protein
LCFSPMRQVMGLSCVSLQWDRLWACLVFLSNETNYV